MKARHPWLLAIVTAATAIASAGEDLRATECTVPGTHATISVAAADPSCSSVDLAPGTHDEDVEIRRAVTVSGAPAGATVLRGSLRVQTTTGIVTLSGFDLETPCAGEAMSLLGNSNVRVEGMAVRADPELACADVYADDFESGGTAGWSLVIGQN